MAGLVYTFAAERFNATLATIDEVEQVTGLPVIAQLPLLRGGTKRQSGESRAEFEVVLNPRSEFAEALRALRTSIMLSANRRNQVLMITSTFPSEGKSTVALNYAAILAQTSARVLLIDADMRRPTLMQNLRLPRREGLSDVLSGLTTGEHVIVDVPGVAGLKAISSGSIPPRPSELLASEEMRSLIEGLRSEFDHIVIDTPPTLVVADAMVLTSLSDKVIYVCRANVTNRYAVQRGIALLTRAGAAITGVVLNAVDVLGTNYYYYGGQNHYREYYGE